MSVENKQKIKTWMINNSQKFDDLFDCAVNHFKAQHNKQLLDYIEFLFYKIEKANKEFEKQRIPFLTKMVRD